MKHFTNLVIAVLATAAAQSFSAPPPLAQSTVVPSEEVRVTARQWQLQPFEPEDGKRVVKEVKIDDLPDDQGLDMGLEDAFGPGLLEKPKEKKVKPKKDRSGAIIMTPETDGHEELTPPLQWPTEGDLYWGWFRFESGAWWSTTMLMKEANTLQFELPREGVLHNQYAYNNVWLRTYEGVDASWKGKRVSFEISGLKGCDANLYVNRKLAGALYRPDSEIDISSFLEYGKDNELLLLVTANGYMVAPATNDTYVGRPKNVQYTGIGQHNFNITGKRPKLVVRPPLCITDVFADTSWRSKMLSVEIDLFSSKPLENAVLEAEVFDADGKSVKKLSRPFSAEAGSTTVRGEIPWEDPITWEFGRGYLYTLRTAVKTQDGTIGHKDVRFGFREIWRDGRKIYMNGHEQKFRMCYNFGAGLDGAEFLSRLGYNVIQYAHNNRDIDPIYSEDLLYGLAEKGLGCAIATTQIFYNKRGRISSNVDVRTDYERLLARNLRRYRNIPSVVMCYLGVNINIQNWTQDALHLGSGASGQYDKLITDMAATAHRTNPNVLFYSHGDGINADIATANLYFNWIPLQERFEWPSRWAVRGNYPFQAAEFGHPYQNTWFRDGHHDTVSELLAIYYGDEAYRQEPQSVRIRHGDYGILYIRRMQHPLYWRFLDEFAWGINRYWRTFGINGGVVWFNLDQGFGMPGWKLESIWNEYGANYSDATFKKIGGVPEGRPEWAFPSWDIYQRGNKDFLGYIGGWPRHTDRRHAYLAGETVEKQIVVLDDSFAPGACSVDWSATLDGKDEIAKGSLSHTPASNVPILDRISFKAPPVQSRTAGKITAVFRNAASDEIARDELGFEVYPEPKPTEKPSGATIALFDPRGETAKWLESMGLSGFKRIDSLNTAAIGDAPYLIIGSYALATGDLSAIAPAVAGGLKVLVMEQGADAWKRLGFVSYDAAPRRLWLRDTSNPAFSAVTDGDLRDWAGQPQVPPGAKTYEGQTIGHLSKGDGPRWTRNMAVALHVIRTPDTIGYIPQIEGEFDMNMSALLKWHSGKGSIQFCTLALEGRTLSYPPETKDAPDDVRPVRDPACDTVARALLADFLAPSATDNSRGIEPFGPKAQHLARECGVKSPESTGAAPAKAASGVLLVGPDADIDWPTLEGRIKGGATAIVFANEKIAAKAGFTFSEPATNYCATFDGSDPALRGIGQNLLRWRSMMLVRPYASAPVGFKLNADGLVASGMDGHVVFTQIDPFQIQTRVTGKAASATDGAATAAKADEAADGGPAQPAAQNAIALEEPKDEKAEEKKKLDAGPSATHTLSHVSMTVEHGYQFFSRLLTNLGAAPSQTPEGQDAKLYNLPGATYDPYFFKYW